MKRVLFKNRPKKLFRIFQTFQIFHTFHIFNTFHIFHIFHTFHILNTAILVLALLGVKIETASARYCEALFDHTRELPPSEAEAPFRGYNHQGPSFYNPRYKWAGGKRNRQIVAPAQKSEHSASRLPIYEIRFMQSTASNNMSTSGLTVLDTARNLKSGNILPEDITPIRTWQDSIGRIWTLDHRRLAAMHLAGVHEVPVSWVGEKTVVRESYKKASLSAGRLMLVRFTDEKGILVGWRSERSPLKSKQKEILIRELVAGKNASALMSEIRDFRIDDLIPLDVPSLKPTKIDDSSKELIIESLQRKNSDFSSSPFVFELSEIRAQSDGVNITDKAASSSVLREARIISKGEKSLATVGPIRVWQDSYGRVWTPDLAKLAALRLALPENAKVPVEWSDEKSLPLSERVVTSKSLGRSLIIPLPDYGLGVVTVLGN